MPRAKPLPGQLDLDGEPYEPPASAPAAPKPRVPTWGRLRKQDRTCDECFQDQAALHKAGRPVGRRRTARYRRSFGGLRMLLCNPHADLWRAKDRLPKLDHDKNGTRV